MMRSSRGGGRVPLITPTATTRPMKKVAQSARPGTMRCSRSVGRTFFLSGKQQFPGGHADAIGRRPTMEDACVCIGEFAGPRTQYYAVFDGHGGREASAYCAEKLHSIIASKYVKGEPLGPIIAKSIHEINQNIISSWEYAGTTAAIAIIADNKIYTANVGDSRVILVKDQKAIRLSVDHKATAPRERRAVLKRGGSIFQGRVNGILMLSRAIGDATVARYISDEPYQTETPFQEGLKLILACDGVWDVMSDQNAADIFIHSPQPVDAARAIKNEALKRGSMDNVSVICVDLTYKDELKESNEIQYQNEHVRHSRRQRIYKDNNNNNNILNDKEKILYQFQETIKLPNIENNQEQEKENESEEITDSEKNEQPQEQQQEQKHQQLQVQQQPQLQQLQLQPQLQQLQPQTQIQQPQTQIPLQQLQPQTQLQPIQSQTQLQQLQPQTQLQPIQSQTQLQQLQPQNQLQPIQSQTQLQQLQPYQHTQIQQTQQQPQPQTYQQPQLQPYQTPQLQPYQKTHEQTQHQQKQQKQHHQQKQQQRQQQLEDEFTKPQHLQIQSLQLTLQKTKPNIVVTKKQNQQNNNQYQQYQQQYYKTSKIQGYQLEPRPPKMPNQENQLSSTLTIHRPHRTIRQDSK